MDEETVLLGYLAGICTTAAFLPQVIRSWRTRSLHDLSPTMLVIFAAGLILWVMYGYRENRTPIIAANLVTLGLVSVLFWLWLRERRHQGG